MRAQLPRELTRRSFMVGSTAAAGALLLGACSDDDDDVDTSGSASTAGGDGGGASAELFLAQFFGPGMLVAGSEMRAPFGVRDGDGLLRTGRTPASLTVELFAPDGSPVGAAIEVARHHDQLPNAYFPLRATVPGAGIYTARPELDGQAVEMQLPVMEPSQIPWPGAATTDENRVGPG